MIRFTFVRRLFVAISVGIGLILMAPQAMAQAKCDLVMSAMDTWELQYDPFGDAQNSATFEIQFVNSGHTPCVGRLSASSLGDKGYLESDTTSARVPFALRDVSNSNNITPGTSGRLTGRTTMIRSDDSGAGRIEFRVTPPQNLQAGRYTQFVDLEFIMPNGTVHATKRVLLVLNIKPSLIIGLAGQVSRIHGVPTLDLGELTQDGEVPLQARVYVRSSTNYQITVTSVNNGVLRHRQQEWTIPYSLKMGGQDIALGAPYHVTYSHTGAPVDNYPLQIFVRDIAGKRAGRYTDVLRFTVAAI